MASGELAIRLVSSSQISMDIPQSQNGAFIDSSGSLNNNVSVTPRKEQNDTFNEHTNSEERTPAGGQKRPLSLDSETSLPDEKRCCPQESARTANSPSSSPNSNESKNAKTYKTKQEREAERLRKQEEKQREKEEREAARRKKAQEKEQERMKKEEERKQREQEKEQKRAERMAKEQEKENKRKAKEEEIQRDQERIDKLQRSQLRLKSFFTKKNPESVQQDKSAKEKEDEEATPESDYSKHFLPFNVKTGLILAPTNQFISDDGKFIRSRPIEDVYNEIEQILKGHSDFPDTLPPVKSYFDKKALRKRGKEITLTAREVIARLSSDLNTTEEEYRSMLGSLRCVQLKFAEDIRLPYVGTCTKKCKVPRNNPFFHYSHVDYSVDSEAEWVEDDAEQAEDLAESGDEEDEEMEDDDVMSVDSFLDDSEDIGRRTHMAPLVPIQLGISWSDPVTGANPIFDSIETRAQVLHPQVDLPIDPFKDYWRDSLSAPNNVQDSNSNPKATGIEKLMIDEKDMKAFIKSIHGNDGTKGYMIEFLKKEFPHISRKCIRSSLDSISQRVGSKADKRWKVKDEVLAMYG